MDFRGREIISWADTEIDGREDTFSEIRVPEELMVCA
jgi:hypothetical protein